MDDGEKLTLDQGGTDLTSKVWDVTSDRTRAEDLGSVYHQLASRRQLSHQRQLWSG